MRDVKIEAIEMHRKVPAIESRGCLGALLVFCTLTAMVALWMVVKL